MKPECIICGKKKPASKAHLFHCGRPKCQPAYQEWAAANWEKLPEGPWRQKYEDDFWEVTPEQREQFKRFFELQRPFVSRRKARKCLRCGAKVSNANSMMLVDYRLCGSCRHSNSTHYGRLANG